MSEKQFFRVFRFIFLKEEKERFLKFTWLLSLPSKASWDRLYENPEFDSVPGLSLSKVPFTWEILCQVSVFGARTKLSALILLPRVFKWIPP